MYLGYRGRNAIYFKENLRTELIKIYNKDFIVNLKFKISKGKDFERYDEIAPDDYGIKKIKDEMERIKFEKLSSLRMAEEKFKIKKKLANFDK